jgi:hypothetical protein
MLDAVAEIETAGVTVELTVATAGTRGVLIQSGFFSSQS